MRNFELCNHTEYHWLEFLLFWWGSERLNFYPLFLLISLENFYGVTLNCAIYFLFFLFLIVHN